jgi:hypothetical protein
MAQRMPLCCARCARPGPKTLSGRGWLMMLQLLEMAAKVGGAVSWEWRTEQQVSRCTPDS